MLRYVYGFATGAMHVRNGGCGADSALAMHDGDTLLFALSDGAGSSSLSHRVSDALVYEAIRLMLEGVGVFDIPTMLATLIQEMFHGIPRRHLYATLAVGTYRKGHLVYSSVGDSAILYRVKGAWHCAPIVKGEFANETVFLLSDGWKDMVKTGSAEGVDAIVVSSDGLGGVYFYYRQTESGWVVEPSEKYLDKLVSATVSGALTFENIHSLLSSEKLMSINDDDKSVVIACDSV